MKSKKLNLNELKVKSFVTNLENGKDNTVKGGRPHAATAEEAISCGGGCVSYQDMCSDWIND